MCRNFVSRDETTIRFHIQTITPSKAVARIKRNKKKEGEAVADWLTRCGELEIIYLISVVCRPQHAGLMFVELDGMTKATELLRPTMCRDESLVIPGIER